jgi:Fe-S cluster assembly scaffold protein SufB
MIFKNFEQLAISQLRRQALSIAAEGYAAIDTRRAIEKYFRFEPGSETLWVKGKKIELKKFKRVICVGFGKAAFEAVSGIYEKLGSRIACGYVIDLKDGQIGNLVCKIGTHPTPTLVNVKATQELVKMLSGLSGDDLVICVVSGGGSALLCYPHELSCEKESEIISALTVKGADIFELNTVRKHISKVKGGQLAKTLYPATCISLIFSDVPINDHKFVMLHAAVWSGGTFIYVPKNVKVDLPLQAYFRMNAERGGQFEHTLIIADEGSEVQYIEGCSAPKYNANALHAGCVEIFVHKNARVRYSSIENWSKNTYNLNTKRALVDEDGVIEWVNGNMGSGTTMLYPCSILRGRGARSDSLGVAFAGPGQNQDTGSKVIHAAPHTKSTIRSKSISAGGGVSTYRGLVKVTQKAENSDVSVNCDALILDDESISNTVPDMKIENEQVNIVHEARVGKIGDDEIFYLMSRGLDEEQSSQLVVSGFIEPIVKALPLEYALELNKLIEMEMEGAVG